MEDTEGNNSLLFPTTQQLELWRKATNSNGGLNEYREWILTGFAAGNASLIEYEDVSK